MTDIVKEEYMRVLNFVQQKNYKVEDVALFMAALKAFIDSKNLTEEFNEFMKNN